MVPCAVDQHGFGEGREAWVDGRRWPEDRGHGRAEVRIMVKQAGEIDLGIFPRTGFGFRERWRGALHGRPPA